jgi:hypothetical protein
MRSLGGPEGPSKPFRRPYSAFLYPRRVWRRPGPPLCFLISQNRSAWSHMPCWIAGWRRHPHSALNADRPANRDEHRTHFRAFKPKVRGGCASMIELRLSDVRIGC